MDFPKTKNEAVAMPFKSNRLSGRFFQIFLNADHCKCKCSRRLQQFSSLKVSNSQMACLPSIYGISGQKNWNFSDRMKNANSR
jgi:hypothetical protein